MRGLRLPNSSLRLSIPDDAGGTRETLKHMRQLVQQSKLNHANRDLANSIIGSVPAKDWTGELCALFEWVRANIRYTLDPNDQETIQDAQTTVRLGYGDCDDFAILLSTLCECIGHPSAFVALGFGDTCDYSHVLVIASGAGETDWVWMDPTEGHPFGWFPPGATCEIVCPITETAQYLLEG